MGFDTIELDVSSLKVPEEVLLRYIRLIKSAGLKAKPQLAVKVESSEIPAPGIRAFGAYQPPVARKSGKFSRSEYRHCSLMISDNSFNLHCSLSLGKLLLNFLNCNKHWILNSSNIMLVDIILFFFHNCLVGVHFMLGCLQTVLHIGIFPSYCGFEY